MPRIIPTMIELGYSPNKRGICFGIASMGAQAVIREEPMAFFDRVVRIHNLTEENIKSIIKDREHRKVDDLYYFFDGIAIYHGPSALDIEFSKIIPNRRQSIQNKTVFKGIPHSIANQDKQFRLSGIKAVLVCSINIEQFESLVLELKSYLGEQAFSLMIHYLSPPHTVQLGYSNNQWLTVNHDEISVYDNDEASIEKIIQQILPKKGADKKEVLNISIDILLSEQSNTDLQHLTKKYELSDEKIIALKQNKKLLIDLIQCCVYSNKNKTLQKIFAHIDLLFILDEYLESDVPALFLAAQDGHIDIVNTLIKLIENTELTVEQKKLLFSAKTIVGIPALYIAAQNGHADIVKVLSQSIEKSALTQDQKLTLLSAKIESGTPALYIAAQNGFDEAVKELIQTIERSKFTSKEKFLLLEAKTQKGNPALSMAVQEGHVKVIKALIHAFESAWFTPEQKILLLEANNQNDAPALYMAVKNNHVKVVELLLGAIEKAKLTFEQKISLLEVGQQGGLSILARLVQEGSVEIINAFIQTIDNLQLPIELQMSLLGFRNQYGISALLIAAQNGYIAIFDALVKAVDRLDISETQKAQFIVRGSKNRDSILRRAAIFGNLGIVKYLVDYVLSSDISIEEKVGLLAAKRRKNGASLYNYLFGISHLAIYAHIIQYLEKSVVNSPEFTCEQKKKILGLPST